MLLRGEKVYPAEDGGLCGSRARTGMRGFRLQRWPIWREIVCICAREHDAMGFGQLRKEMNE